MHSAYLSLGSNIDPERHLREAAAALRARFGEVLFSDVVRTPAVGFEGPDFLNAAAVIHTDLDPPSLDAWLHGLETAQGRDRDAPRMSSRTLDIDIVFFDQLVLAATDGSHLQIPRPELQHAFVLQPLAQIAPDYCHPLNGSTLKALWSQHPRRSSPLPAVLSLANT